jgi:UDP-glucuronate 4-epimerase
LKLFPVLITGVAGFIGSFLAKRFLDEGYPVLGIDEVNDYYDPKLKMARLDRLKSNPKFEFHHLDICDTNAVKELIAKHSIRHIVHLAAQAGVRYSLINPNAYTRSNVQGFLSILEACRDSSIEHLLYASSSSVYGANTKTPFHEDDLVDLPVSYYAATKRANELMAQVYSSQFRIPATGLRFFTVYGPMGRPDMAYWMFTEKIFKGEPIPVYGKGLLSRDFTFIDDVVNGIQKLVTLPPEGSSLHRILNVGNSNPHTVNDLIRSIEQAVGKKAIREDRSQPLGDVERTFADSSKLAALTGFSPSTPLDTGIAKFVDWYKHFYFE